MIDASKLYRARTVENVYLEVPEGVLVPPDQDPGTIVGDHDLSTNRDTLYPLQAALAYEVSKSLFTADNTVLVDGPSDVLYFQWFKRKLASLGRTTLDDRWVVTPSGGIDKIAAFLALFGTTRLHIAVVTDFAASQEGYLSYPRDSELLRHGHVVTLDKYAGKAQADLEGVIGHRTYVELTRNAYNLERDAVRPIEHSGKSGVKVANEVGEFMLSLPQGSGSQANNRFDRYRPAEFLIQQGMDFQLPDLDGALKRFESLFQDLNDMLN